MTVQNRTFQRIRRFFGKEEGTATVEAVLWFPIIIGVFALMVDASMIFHGQTKVLRIIQDGNRHYSIGRFKTDEQTETYILAALASINITGAEVDTRTSSIGVARTTVSVPAAEFQLIGYFPTITIQITSDHVLDDFSGEA